MGMTLRTNTEQTDALRRQAESEGRSMQAVALAAIDEYIAHHNTKPKPFIWTKSARDILQKVIRANSRLSSKQNATLH